MKRDEFITYEGLQTVASGMSASTARKIIGDAIIEGLKTSQTTTASMNVEVGIGSAFVGGQEYNYSTVTTIGITAADATNPRIDIITISDTDGTITYTAGTAAVSPTAPATPTGHLKIANITVGAGVTSITSANIGDARTIIPPMAISMGVSSKIQKIKPDYTLGTIPGTANASITLGDGTVVEEVVNVNYDTEGFIASVEKIVNGTTILETYTRDGNKNIIETKTDIIG